ncbi:insulinase family protein [Kamptonema cortianum]|nr:insulinase family protein [Kamptonema cortianum]
MKTDLDFAKSQALELLSAFAEDDERQAYLKLLQGIFPQVAFELNFKEGIEKISTITIEDLSAEAKSLFLSARPKIVVVGDITQKDLLQLLEETMGALPLPVKTPPKSEFKPQWGAKEEIVKKSSPSGHGCLWSTRHVSSKQGLLKIPSSRICHSRTPF